MKHIFILFLVFSYYNGLAQQIDWQKTTHWKLYDIHNDGAFSYPPDTLAHFKSISLENDTMLNFLTTAIKWTKDNYASWMGYFVASFQDREGKLYKTEISMYGGFFYVEADKQYYEVPKDMRRHWLEYINRRCIKLAGQ